MPNRRSGGEGERTGSAVEGGQDRGGEAIVALPEPAVLEEGRGAGAGLADAVEQGGLGGSHDHARWGGGGEEVGRGVGAKMCGGLRDKPSPRMTMKKHG
jgi:hypothetical protein